MSPFQHGEVFVTDDGAETDLDLGHYERFTSAQMTRLNNFTTGRIYRRGHPEGAARRVPRQDRAGDSAHHRRDQGAHPRGAPRAPTSSSSRSAAPSATSSRCPFLEAIRQLQATTSARENALYVHLTLRAVHRGRRRAEDQAHPALGEGAARDRHPARHPALPHRPRDLAQEMKDKIALFCNVDPGSVFTAPDVTCIYELPLDLHRRGPRRAARRAAQHLEPRAATSSAGSASSRGARSPRRARCRSASSASTST